MKKQTPTNFLIRFTLVSLFALTMAIWSPLQSQAIEPVKGKSIADSQMMEGCQVMMKKKQEMMAEMKAQDVELAALVEKMNSAPADKKKLALTAAVVTRMVEQRTAMHARKAEMQDEMMTHMMQHMQMGNIPMSQCPMMQGMRGMRGMKGMKGMKSSGE